MGPKWCALEPTFTQPAEVYPLDDASPHILGDENCPCRPFWDERILVHRSFDGREADEVTKH